MKSSDKTAESGWCPERDSNPAAPRKFLGNSRQNERFARASHAPATSIADSQASSAAYGRLFDRGSVSFRSTTALLFALIFAVGCGETRECGLSDERDHRIASIDMLVADPGPWSCPTPPGFEAGWISGCVRDPAGEFAEPLCGTTFPGGDSGQVDPIPDSAIPLDTDDADPEPGVIRWDTATPQQRQASERLAATEIAENECFTGSVFVVSRFGPPTDASREEIMLRTHACMLERGFQEAEVSAFISDQVAEIRARGEVAR